MVHILATSSLFHALTTKNSKHPKLLLPSLTIIPGLSFNSNSGNAKKNIRIAYLKDRSDFAIWQDTLNNSITPHKRTNDNRPYDVEELVAFLQRHSDRIKATVHCQSYGAKKKHFKTAVKIGNFSDPVNEAFGVKTEANENQHHQQIIPTISGPRN